MTGVAAGHGPERQDRLHLLHRQLPDAALPGADPQRRLLPRANVRIAAIGGGMAYGPLGPSHHATEDIAVMRALPNMTVIAPGDPVEARLAVRALVAHEGPAYLRLGRANEPVVHATEPAIRILAKRSWFATAGTPP